MATLNSILKSVDTTGEIGSSTASQNKIAEVIISNTSGEDIKYQLKIKTSNGEFPITPKTRLLVGESHIRPMSTFISAKDGTNNTLNITVTNDKDTTEDSTNPKTVDTITSIIEL